MVSFQRAVSLVLFLALASGLRSAPKWLKAQSEDIIVLSDLSQRDLADIALRYAAFRHTLAHLLANPGQKLPPSVLIVFRNSSKLEDLLSDKNDPKKKIISSWTVVDGTTIMAMTFEGDRENTLSLGFEFESESVINRLGYFVPLWMYQGTGEVFASMELKKDRCVIGEDNDRVYRTWADGVGLPWRHFFEMSAASADYAGKDAKGQYQAQAWALMHAILLQPGDLHAHFLEAVRIVQDNPQGGVAAEAMLGVNLTKFDVTITGHMRHEHTVEVPVDVAALKASIKIADAPEAEVRVRTADILASQKKDWLVSAELARANELAPNTPMVDEALARAALADGHPDRALDLYRKALDEGSQNAQAYIFSARARINESAQGGMDHEGDGGTNIPPAIDEIHKALKIDPSDRQAWELLARAYYLKNTIAPGDGDELAPALTNDADGLSLRYRRALIYKRLGQIDLVRSDVAVIQASPACTDELKASAANVLDALQYTQDRAIIQPLADANDYAGALAAEAAGRKKLVGEGYVPAYEKMRSSLEEYQACRVAFDSLREKRYDDFKVQAAAFVDKYPQNRNVAVLREQLERVNDLPAAPVDDSAAAHQAAAKGITPVKPFPPQDAGYLEQMATEIQATWQRILASADTDSLKGMTVMYRFTLNSRGEVVEVLRDSGTGNDAAFNFCRRAIMQSAPFDAWSPEMRKDLGQRQEFFYGFIYE